MAIRELCQLETDWELQLSVPYAEAYSVNWRIVADHGDGPADVADEAQGPTYNLPILGSYYDLATDKPSAFSTVNRIRCRRVRSIKHTTGGDGTANAAEYLYTVEYGKSGGAGNKDTPPGDPLPGDENPDPMQRPEREWYEWETRVQPFTRDANGQSVANSAWEPFTEFTVDTAQFVHVVMQREPGNDATERQALRDKLESLRLKVNSLAWRGHAPRTVLMRPPGCFGPRYENGSLYYEVTYRAVKYDPNDVNQAADITPEDWGTHELVLISQGFTYRRQIAITDGGNPIIAPVKLDGLGRRLPDQTGPVPLCDGVDGRPGPYQRFGEVDFNTHIAAPPA